MCPGLEPWTTGTTPASPPPPTTRGRPRVRTCSHRPCSQGNGSLSGLGESRQAQNSCPRTHKLIKRRQGSGSVTLSILLPPTAICPVEEPDREAATSHALNHSHHRNRSEIHACLLPQLLSSGKMTKSHCPSFNSEVRC